MSTVLSTLMTNAVAGATDFVSDFSPVLYTVAGILLGMWVLRWARDFFMGG